MKAEVKLNKKKIFGLLAGVALVALVILVFILGAVQLSRYGTKGYYRCFGRAVVLAEDNLMLGKADDSFSTGSAISFKLLKNTEKSQLVRGSVILVERGESITVARIAQKQKDGLATIYIMQYDALGIIGEFETSPDQVVGEYLSQSASSGAFLAFADTFSGVLVFYVFPAIAVAVYIFSINRAFR